MNLQTAKIILELPEDYNLILLKQNYHRLAKLHHPDKCNDPNATNKFTQLNDAYSFMIKNINVNVPDFNDILKTFNSFFKNIPVTSNVKKMIIMLTPKEYLLGCTKEIPIYSKCNCQPELCVFCAGSGYEIPNIFKTSKLEVCLECMGGGIIQNCGNCKFGDKKIGINILTINKKINLDKTIKFENFEISLKLDEPYFYKNEKLYCYFEISLKESLTGFTKSFNDAFGYKHNIKTDCIIKCGDGYSLKHLILIFRVIYPECISKENIDKLKLIDF